MNTISELFGSMAHAVKDRVFKEADHSECGDDIVIMYSTKYPTLHKIIGILPRDAMCLRGWSQSYFCFSPIDNERWIATEGKQVLTGREAQSWKKDLIETNPKAFARAFGIPKNPTSTSSLSLS